jgi:hypothetical protein
MKTDCNHYLGYFYTYEWIDEITMDRIEKWDFLASQMVWFLDGRIQRWHKFNYCPACWAQYNFKDWLKSAREQAKVNK